MKTAVFSIHNFEKEYLLQANSEKHELVLIEARLSETSVVLAKGCEAISIFTGDKTTAPVLEALHKIGVKFIALRSAGFNHVDLIKAKELNMKVARVPAYSPYAIAEHAVALMLALNRKLIRSHHRVMDLNFSLDGLVGFDMNGKTVGIIGTGKIGSVLARILHGFGCRILACDKQENKELVKQYKVEYTSCELLCVQSDIITLHLPLTEDTRYIIDKNCIDNMKPGVMLINTSRGGLVNSKAVINALKTKHIGSFGMDVYEEEEGLFFEDHSEDILQDDTIARLMTFKNVIITSHQAFLTDTALRNISETTIANLDCFEKNEKSQNEL
ncbi:MAG: 2-hydroxyacid dehydrogenase [Bacteroidia bacterium]|jgi:D-lactate dehydrogenase